MNRTIHRRLPAQDSDGRTTPARAGEMALKVPEVTGYFWLAKILTTAMGETTSDFMNQRIGPVIAVPLMLIGLGFALRLQFRKTRYEAWSYWLVVVMVAVFGTSAADALHVVLGIPYVISTSFYVVVLAGVLVAWYRSEGTLSIHSISTRRRENYYWATVLATFALGTAAGDMTATSFHLGYLASVALFAAAFAVPAIGYWRFRLNPIVGFWAAYIITRPLGASLSDWAAVTRKRGGLNFGPGWVSLVLTLFILGLVWYLARTRLDEPSVAERQAATKPAHHAPALEVAPALE